VIKKILLLKSPFQQNIGLWLNDRLMVGGKVHVNIKMMIL
jgi:hypothetical protein